MAVTDNYTTNPVIANITTKYDYVLRREDRVEKFIAHNPFLVELIGEAYSELRKVFKTETLYLEIYRDRDGSQYDQLQISIGTKKDPIDANRQLDEFDHNWWLDNIERSQDKLAIILEY
jgi:hypothetical protein